MKNIHENAPCILQTRWAMSYLAGPLGAEHIRRLSQSTDGADNTSEDKHPHSAHDSPALLPNGIATYYAPGGKNGAPAHYFPTLLAAATLFYQDAKADIRTENKILLRDLEAGLPEFNFFQKMWYGSPTWSKVGTTSGGVSGGALEGLVDGDKPCQCDF